MDAAFSSATEKFRFKGGRGQCGQHSGGSSAQGGRGSGGDGSARASNRLHESYPSNCSSAIDTYNGSTCEQEAKVRRSVCLCIVAALSRAFRILWIALEPAKSLPSPAVASRCRHRHCCTAAALDRQLPAPVPGRHPPPPPRALPHRRLEINEADRAVLTLKSQVRKLEQQRNRVR